MLQFSGPAAIAPITANARSKVPTVGLHRNFTDASLNATYQLGGGFSVTSLTAYQRENLKNVDNYTHANEDVYDFYSHRNQHATSEEIRIASPQSNRLRGLVGLYYIDQTYDTNEVYIMGTQNIYAPLFGGVGTITAGSPVAKTFSNKAVFGSVSFDILPNVTASFEGRYQREKVNNQQGTVSAQFVTNAFLPRFILDYKISPGIMVYGSIAKGNKPTQANASVLALSPERQAIAAAQGLTLVAAEEKVTNYELGIKTRFWDNRVTLNADVFYADWKDKQTVTSIGIDYNNDGRIDPSLTGANREYFVGVIVPQGNERVTGAEVEAVIHANRDLTLSGSFAYTNPVFLRPTIIPTYSGTLDASDLRDPISRNIRRPHQSIMSIRCHLA